MVTVEIRGVRYELATTLRVAYKVQGQHNHKAYSKVFSEIGDMPLEEQIGILFVAFQIANPEVKMTQQEFLNYYLDNFKMKEVLDQLKNVIQEIMGVDEDDQSEEPTTSSQDSENQGN